jgi:hypothetical protein
MIEIGRQKTVTWNPSIHGKLPVEGQNMEGNSSGKRKGYIIYKVRKVKDDEYRVTIIRAW